MHTNACFIFITLLNGYSFGDKMSVKTDTEWLRGQRKTPKHLTFYFHFYQDQPRNISIPLDNKVKVKKIMNKCAHIRVSRVPYKSFVQSIFQKIN